MQTTSGYYNMTFIAYETDKTGGFSPVELYTFIYQGVYTRFTSGQNPITVGGFDFVNTYIERGELTTGADNSNNTLPITVSKNNTVPIFYKQRIPVDTYSVIIERMHLKDPDEETRVIFTGSIQNVIFKDNKFAEVNCSPVTNMLDGLILRPDHQSKCNHTIYDDYCSLDSAAYEGAATIIGLDEGGTLITFDALPLVEHADQYVGGLLRQGSSFSTLLTQDGNTLKSLLAIEGMSIGDVVNIATGCQNNFSRCKLRFNNSVNYLGFRDMPTRNPVGSTIYGDA